MNGSNDQNLFNQSVLRQRHRPRTNLVFLRRIPYKINDLETRSRVQPARRFIQEEYFRARYQLACNTDPALLPTRYTLANGCTNQRISLLLQPKRLQQGIYSCDSFRFGDGSELVVSSAVLRRMTA